MGIKPFGWVLIWASMMLVAAPCYSLEYEPVEVDGTQYLVVRGQFLPTEDISRFESALRQSNAPLIVFDSSGGNIHSAMNLGRSIRALGLNTFQIRKMECASACALAFVGGVRRHADPGSIGVHRSSFSDEVPFDRDQAVAKVQEGTADILGYLREMGVDPGFLEFSLRYDQSDIRYLSRSEMKSLGVITGDSEFSRTMPQFSDSAGGTSEAKSGETLEMTAIRFVQNLVELDSVDSGQALAKVRATYAEFIDYYGKLMTLSEVLADKSAYFRRWPERYYRVRPNSTMATCANGMCMVSGVCDWVVRSVPRNKQAKGAAKFSYTIRLGDAPKVIAEGGAVLK